MYNTRLGYWEIMPLSQLVKYDTAVESMIVMHCFHHLPQTRRYVVAPDFPKSINNEQAKRVAGVFACISIEGDRCSKRVSADGHGQNTPSN